MLVTITEKYTNGVYTKVATTVENGTDRVLGVFMCFGGRFKDQLSKFEDGMNNISIIETTADAISIKGTLKLDAPVIESSKQEAEAMA